MSIISSFIKLSSKDKILAMESLFWLIMIRVMLWIFPFSYVQKRVQKIADYIFVDDSNVPLQRISLMILASSKYVPRASCLVQALAGYLLFSKYGYNTLIKIGVSNEDGVFEAHAWVEHDEKVVLGESEKKYKTIMDVDGG
ncbi:MAG: lasso peptide biosynthesis B2 protein [Methanobacterium sp.]|nr:lasso peptide biosynthesis B2 protein [Methanobacterium sp.]